MSNENQKDTDVNFANISPCASVTTKQIEGDIYAAAIKDGGLDLQFHMAMEECLELSLAILRLYRKRGSYMKIAEEVADVEILCGQLRTIIGDKVIDEFKQRKLLRLVRRIKEGTLHNDKGEKSGFDS